MTSNDSPNQSSNSSCHWIVSGAGQRMSIRSMASRSFISLKEKTRHDRLARTRIIRQQKPQPGLRQHFHVNRFDPER